MHVLHASLGATLRAVVHTENTPPLWYLIEWVDARLLGDGALALRLPSALAGIATVPVAWAIGRELAGRRAALIARGARRRQPAVRLVLAGGARLRAVRAHRRARDALLRARCCASRRRGALAAFALRGALALLTHYFAVFLLVADGAVAAARARARAGRRCRPSRALALVGLALLPLISAQGGHGTQWIGRWALSQPPAGDPAVLPDRLLRRAARPRRRAARRAADPRRRALGAWRC